MELTLEQSWIVRGRYYGFPECCISGFLEYCAKLDDLLEKKDFTGFKLLKDSKLDNPLLGTGYVPCSKCESKRPSELTATISKSRRARLPFPETEEYEVELEHIQSMIEELLK